MTYPKENTLMEKEKDREKKMVEFLETRKGIVPVQENGQRRFGPPPDWTGTPPQKGCEVFVGKLPRDVFEDELVPLFEAVGPIYTLRLMMDFTGCNRGFAFVCFTKRGDARKAVRQLNNYEIRKGHYIGVVKSIDNCRLFVGGIPNTKSRDEILDEMQRITEGVTDVILYPKQTDKTRSRGFAFVEYEDHKKAAMARRKLMPGRIPLFGNQDIAVDWAEPEPDVDEDIMALVKILYVRNLMLSTTEDRLKDLFGAFSENCIEKVKKLKDYAFVHFTTREAAAEAMKNLHNTDVDGSTIEVIWAKPVDKNYKQRKAMKQAGNQRPVAVYAATPGTDIPAGPFILGSNPIMNGGWRGNRRSATGIRSAPSGYLATYAPPPPPQTRASKKTVDVLADMSNRNSWGEPRYIMSPIKSSNPNSVPLYMCKVVLPNLPSSYNGFQAQKMSRSPEEARMFAAEHALSQLGVPIEGSDTGSQSHYPQMMPVSRISWGPGYGPPPPYGYVSASPAYVMPAYDGGHYDQPPTTFPAALVPIHASFY